MKHAPTFADTVLRESFRSKNEHVPAICRYALAQARRFVLDANASTFLSDLSHANFSGTFARAVRAMEASRVLARAPHAITWIEYLPREERRRTLEAYPGFAPANKDKTLTSPDEVCEHTGWLIRQHPNDENLFRLVLFNSQSAIPAVMMPYDIIWRTDNQPVRFTKLPRPDDLTDEEQYAVMARIATGIPYKTKSIGFASNDRTAAFSPETVQSLALEMAGELRKVLTLLACINDIPIGVRHVTQTHGFVAAGRYRKFLDHTIIHLNLPKGRDPQKVARAAIAASRKRAHQVRGHWRRDWRHEGQRIWVHEHQRGDASLGFVTHDYKVEHDVDQPRA